jgi:tetratricopeptide (TPR) repeat protein
MVARQSVILRFVAAFVLIVSILAGAAPTAGAAELPAVARAAMEKGLAAARNQDYRGAKPFFEEARKADPNAPEPLFNLGLAESRIPGRELAALVWLRAYLAADPDSIQARKVRDLCGQLEATAQETIRKLIDLELKVLTRLPETGWKYTTFTWMVTYRLRLGDLGAARQIAESMGSMKGPAYYRIAQYLAGSGDIEGAMKTADLASDKGYLYSSIAVDQARTGDVPGTLKTMELARRSGRDDFSAVLAAMAVRGDVEGSMKIAEAAGIKSAAFYIAKAQAGKGDPKGAIQTAEKGGYARDPGLCRDIAEAQAKKGDLSGAMQTAQRGGLARSSEAYGYIAGVQAQKNDVRAARQTVEMVDGNERLGREFAYRNIALALALKGDPAGARSAAAQIPPTYQKITDSFEKKGTEWIEAVISLLPTKSSGRLGERANVLLNSRTLAGILDSSLHPWLADLPAYLKSLDATNQPAEIEAGVRRALMGRVEKYMGEESDAKKGGMATLFLRVRDLDKPDND